MYTGKLVFSQLISFLPKYEFQKCVTRYRGHHKVKQFSCWDQFLCLSFAQLTYRESLRDIEACLRSMQSKLYHMGFRCKISRSTLADANEKRDWRIYADFAQVLIHQARDLYSQDDFGLELDETVYALDSTTIDLCLSLFPWATFRKTKGAIKLHKLLRANSTMLTFWIFSSRNPDPIISWIEDILTLNDYIHSICIRPSSSFGPSPISNSGGYIRIPSIDQPVLNVIKLLDQPDFIQQNTILKNSDASDSSTKKLRMIWCSLPIALHSLLLRLPGSINAGGK